MAWHQVCHFASGWRDSAVWIILVISRPLLGTISTMRIWSNRVGNARIVERPNPNSWPHFWEKQPLLVGTGITVLVGSVSHLQLSASLFGWTFHSFLRGARAAKQPHTGESPQWSHDGRTSASRGTTAWLLFGSCRTPSTPFGYIGLLWSTLAPTPALPRFQSWQTRGWRCA